MGDAAELFVFSASDDDTLRHRIEIYQSFLEKRKTGSIRIAALNLAMAQIHGPCRCAIVVETLQALYEALEDVAQGRRRTYILRGTTNSKITNSVWIFSGAGGQGVEPARDLYRIEPSFQNAVAACDKAFHPYLNSSVDEFFQSDRQLASSEMAMGQAVLFSTQMGLAALWDSWGVVPKAVIGHSMGEVAAAKAIGAIGLDSAIRIIIARSKALSEIAGRGGMADIVLSAVELEPRLLKYDGTIEIAAYNSPHHTVVSGDGPPLSALLSELDTEGIRHVRLTDTAGHSRQLEPHLDEMKAALGTIDQLDSTPMFYSTAGHEQPMGVRLDAHYWVNNLRKPVFFEPALQRAFSDGFRQYIEISPNPVLLSIVEEEFRPRARESLTVIPSLRRNQPARKSMLISAAKCFVDGADMQWANIFA